MISWMQKHNKYLVWTIWVATIAFIGAGFVGWGSYDLGSKAGSVAKVGEIEIPQSKLNLVYRNLYAQYNQMFQGKLDEKRAQELGLLPEAFRRVEAEAKILNLAKEFGIVVSDLEVARTIEKIPAFQKAGQFDKSLYLAYLQSQRLKAKTFEATMRENLTLNKTLSLLQVKALPLEIESVDRAIHVADKIAYEVITTQMVQLSEDEKALQNYFEAHKESYQTPTYYTLSLVWTTPDDANVTEEALRTFYENNSFKYLDAKGEPQTFQEAKEAVTKDLQLKKSKKGAQKAYIAFKKGNLEASQKGTFAQNDAILTPQVWKEVTQAQSGKILKPKVVNGRYVTIKIEAIQAPRTMRFEEAKEAVKIAYEKEAKALALEKLAQEKLAHFNSEKAEKTDFLTLQKPTLLKPLNEEESSQFLQKLFTSNKEKGIISLLNKVVVYNIVEQTLLKSDENQTDVVNQTVNQMKNQTFEANLMRVLDAKYPTEVYMKGLSN